MLNALVAYVHFLAAFTLVFSIIFEWFTYSRNVTLIEAKRLQTIDVIYGISAAVVLVFGFLRILYFEKGSEFYFHSPFYKVKLYTFLVVGILSIYPTVKFFKWRKVTTLGVAPTFKEEEFKIIKWILRVEVAGLLIIILSASFMAKGIGY
jgi:putative membrane protein